MSLKEKVKNLPSSPGVYLMKDSLNSIIYVGKSKNLKSRVSSYFQNSKSHSPKVIKLVKNLKDFDYILTDTEFEAFILECKLIKTIKPMYNRQMKNPKSYSYIKIIVNEKYPSIEISNESSEIDGNIYFGPYTSRNTVERGIEGIKKFCKTFCSNNSRKASSCLNYSLGLCLGMCLDNTPSKQYLNIFDKIIKLLEGNDKSLLTEMEHKMNGLSDNFDFEKAAKYRDYISAVNYLIDKVKVIEFAEENKNIALLEHLSNNVVKFFLIKGNKLLFSEKYIMEDIKNLKSIFKNNILFYFKDTISNNSIKIGREEIDEAQIIYSYLQNKSNNCNYIVIPEKWFSTLNNASIDNTLDKLILP